jgi:hypothetical protein
MPPGMHSRVVICRFQEVSARLQRSGGVWITGRVFSKPRRFSGKLIFTAYRPGVLPGKIAEIIKNKRHFSASFAGFAVDFRDIRKSAMTLGTPWDNRQPAF